MKKPKTTGNGGQSAFPSNPSACAEVVGLSQRPKMRPAQSSCHLNLARMPTTIASTRRLYEDGKDGNTSIRTKRAYARA